MFEKLINENQQSRQAKKKMKPVASVASTV